MQYNLNVVEEGSGISLILRTHACAVKISANKLWNTVAAELTHTIMQLPA